MDIDKHTYVYKCTKFEAEVIYISQTLYIPSLAQKNGRKKLDRRSNRNSESLNDVM